jgi:hypothetical protein
MGLLSNRQNYERGQIVGPFRTINLNVGWNCATIGDLGLVTVPLILGNGNDMLARGNSRKITADYEVDIVDTTVGANQDAFATVFIQTYTKNSEFFTGAATCEFRWINQYNLQSLYAYLQSNKLFLKEFEVQTFSCAGRINPDGTFNDPNPLLGIFPKQVGLFDNRFNNYSIDRVSVNTFLSPNIGSPTSYSSGATKNTPFLFKVPTDIILSDTSAIILDFESDPHFSNLNFGISISLTVANFKE